MIALFLSLLPVYIFGNFHCIGMCGPLVMMIGKHRFRYFYFIGRTLSFMFAGAIAGEMGAVINIFLQRFHIPSATSFLFGGLLVTGGLTNILGRTFPGSQWLSQRFAHINQTLSLLILRDRAWPTFLFGFFTVALPCGQTLLVFSACAVYGDFWAGLVNGLAFALFTSPSLWLSMHAHKAIRGLKPYYNTIVGICAIIIGSLALWRGFVTL